jgi:hypothetical protein
MTCGAGGMKRRGESRHRARPEAAAGRAKCVHLGICHIKTQFTLAAREGLCDARMVWDWQPEAQKQAYRRRR